jgi:hypothetical protein
VISGHLSVLLFCKKLSTIVISQTVDHKYRPEWPEGLVMSFKASISIAVFVCAALTTLSAAVAANPGEQDCEYPPNLAVNREYLRHSNS